MRVCVEGYESVSDTVNEVDSESHIFDSKEALRVLREAESGLYNGADVAGGDLAI